MKNKYLASAQVFLDNAAPLLFVIALCTLSQTVALADGLSLSVTPSTATLGPSQTVTLAASGTGAVPGGVVWSLSSNVGTLVSTNNSTIYKAPSIIGGSNTITVTATSMADKTKKASALLKLVPLVALTVAPSAFTIEAGTTQQVTSAVTGSSNGAVTWGLQPALGTIDNTGLYTAPSNIASNQTVSISAQSVANPAVSAMARVTITPSVSITMGPKGLTALSFRGQNLLYPAKANPGIGAVVMTDATGQTVNGSPTATSVVTDTVANTVTSTYPWGVVTTGYRARGNKLLLTVTVRNTTTDKTINRLWMFPVTLQLPSMPLNLAKTQAVNFNIDSPSSVYFNYGTGAVDLVNDDVTMPLASGFWAAQSPAGTLWSVMLETDSGHSINNSWPTILRPIAPLASDQYTVSMRFGGSTSTETQLAGDIFALYGTSYPRVVTPPAHNRPIAALSLSGNHRSNPFPTNPHGWFNDPKVDTTTTAGIAAFQARLLNYADGAITEMQRVGAQGGILWDIEGQSYTASYIGDPAQAEIIAPELVGVLDAFVNKFTSAGFRIGFTLRPPAFTQQTGFVNVNGANVTWAGGAQFSPSWIGAGVSGSIVIGGLNYQIASVQSPTSLTLTQSPVPGIGLPYAFGANIETPDPLATLKSKIQYVQNRWGPNASLFYVDSDSSWDGTVTPAAVFQNLLSTFPGTLIFPEHANTRHYAYTLQYTDYNDPNIGPAPNVMNVYSKASALIKVNETMASQFPNQLLQAAINGNILMFDGWYRHPANDVVQSIYTQVP